MALLPAPSNPEHDAMGSAGLPHHAMPTRDRLVVEKRRAPRGREGAQSPLWRPRAGRRTVLTSPRKGDRDGSEEKVHTEGQPFAAAG